MFTQFNAISKSSLQSFAQLLELNVFTVNTIASQHSKLFKNVVNESIAFVQSTSLDVDLPNAVANQNKFSLFIYYETIETWEQTADTLALVKAEADLIFSSLYGETSDEVVTKADEKKLLKNLL